MRHGVVAIVRGVDERRFARLAMRQHGVVTLDQLRRLGLTADAVRQRARAGRLVRLHRGVYAVAGAPLTPRGRWLAAVLAVGPGAVLSHASAAALWDIRPTAAGLVDVYTTDRSRRSRPGIRVHRPRRLDDADIATVEGIPVTTVARTIVDLSTRLTAPALARLLNEAEIRRRLDLRAIEASSRPGRAGERLRQAVETYRDGPTRSALEDRFAELVDRMRLPRPARNVRVDVGTRSIEVDALWADRHLVVELDGAAYHRTRRAFEEDRRRDAELQAAGYRVLLITPRRLERDARGVRAELEALLRATAQRRSPRTPAAARG